MADFRAMCAELLEALENAIRVIYHEDGTKHISTANPVITRARAALAQPEPQGPSDEELRELRRFHQWPIGEFLLFTISRAALARWGRPAIEPVPVSERLPGPEDVNDDGEVWVEEPAYDYPLGDTGDYDSEPGRWVLRPLSSLDKRFKRRWLPNGALPMPVVEDADG
jgi:hypothetical protein